MVEELIAVVSLLIMYGFGYWKGLSDGKQSSNKKGADY